MYLNRDKKSGIFLIFRVFSKDVFKNQVKLVLVL